MQLLESQVAQSTIITNDETRVHGSGYSFQKGQRIFYEGEEAEIIRTNPLFVIKTNNRIVCGDLHKRCKYIPIDMISQRECEVQ